ncbi:adenylyl-sulfate kinase [Nonomuraea zeae]|uniref:Adenylyl-sulfate kinase n=1 Tax=Nonomuraea zeae TaxID=1642303 RepID=A0A5S4GHM2_9ACTN|nr:adenylyl-sulfate kinase [Nonomuraea zeae]TMR32475.1 adenylyl-sulfate kinase [Nonomuraea zeae]
MSDHRLPLLWLCGPSGAGKSSAGWEIFAQLSRSGVRTAFVDGDQIGLCMPLPEDRAHRLRARNLAAMWPNLRLAGARCVVLSGFVHASEEVGEYTRLLPDAALTVCRLRVDPGELKDRFLGRGWRPDLLAEAVADAEALERTDFADVCVDTGGLTVAEAATLVRARTGLTEPACPPDGSGALVPSGPVLDPAPVLWVSGATATGKSTAGYEVFSRLVRSGVPAAYADLKQIGALRPGTGDDPAGHLLKARNLAAVWSGHLAAGARCLVVSGDADRDETVRRYAELLPAAALTVARLHASPATLAERVARRGGGGGPALPGDELKGLGPAALRQVAERAAADAAALDREGAGDMRVDTDGRSAEEVAEHILTTWPDHPERA